MAVTIRPASPADIPELVRLEQACFSLPHTEEQFLHELQDDVYVLFVASEGDVILGYAGLTHILDEGYITNVAVDESARRAGIGSMLVEGMMRRCEALSLLFVTLEVRASNTPAFELYQKHGFVTVGRRKGYYEAPREDAILMTKFWKEVEE